MWFELRTGEDDDAGDAVVVRLLRAARGGDGAGPPAPGRALLRELSLVEAEQPGDDFPAGLIAVADRVQDHLAEAAAAVRAQFSGGERREAADVTFEVPRHSRDDVATLADLLDRADELCREGLLLTLPSSPRMAAARRWYLEEIVAQVDGREAAGLDRPDGRRARRTQRAARPRWPATTV